MVDITKVILEVREMFIGTGMENKYHMINQGECEDFAEQVDNRIPGGVDVLSNDNFVIDNDGEGWKWNEKNVWIETTLRKYNSLPPEPITVEQLTNKVFLYHCWLYDNGKHYDAECPEGVENFFELPFFKRILTEGPPKDLSN